MPPQADMARAALNSLIVFASAAVVSFSADTAEQHRTKFNYPRVQPLLDVPMIDAAITKAPDGGCCLTGTTQKSGNFAVNEGIRLWKSADLKTWTDLGVVAPRAVVKATVAELGLLRVAAEPDELQGLLAPELHFVKGGCYLTYSLKPCGTGLLKSKTGKPEGPYEDVGLIAKEGADASLYVDDDGSVYWVFGGGWIAKMNAAIAALAKTSRLIQPHDTRRGLAPGAQILQVGTGGAFLFKKEGTYHLLAAGIHGRLGVPCYDTWVATAKSLAGPWSRRKLAVPHGGQSTMFAGPDGQWYATFSGVDCRAAVRERAAIVPVDWVEAVAYWVGTYDSEVFWANEIGGPWHPNRTVLPHGDNSGIFQDDAGGWWHISFANDNSLPDISLLRCLPIEIQWNGRGYDIGPKHKQQTPYVHRPVVRHVDARALAARQIAVKPAYPIVKLPADVPVQDPAITPGEAGIYCLTGTAGTAGDFRNNDGVYLWKSTELARSESFPSHLTRSSRAASMTSA